MKYPIPTVNYDEGGAAARLSAAIHNAGLQLHDIANRDSAASAELLSASAHVADELAKERDSAVLSTVISDLRGTSAVSSLSMVAAILDATAYVADIRHSLKELSEHELPADVQCILHDMADEMYCRDHAKSTAEWISDSAA